MCRIRNLLIVSDTRHLILLPLKYPDGELVPAHYITDVQIKVPWLGDLWPETRDHVPSVAAERSGPLAFSEDT